MRVVALISGGKDSNYNLLQCMAAGHKIVALANLRPRDKDELDSYMYQTVGHQCIDLYAKATGLPLYREETNGVAQSSGKVYEPVEGDEVEDLYRLLSRVKNEMNVDGVSSGALFSDYQRVRVENVCTRLGLVSLAYLWHRNQTELLQEMIDVGLDAVVIKVAALGLEPSKHLGLRLHEIMPHLVRMNQKYGLNVCGEGGEYETFTLDCPIFTKRIVVDDVETVIHSDDAFAPVGYLNFKKLSLLDKEDLPLKQEDILTFVKGPLEFLSDLESPEEIVIEPEINDEVLSCSSDLTLPDPIHLLNRCDTMVFPIIQPSVRVNDSGWYFLGSLIGNNSDPCIALSEALKKLDDCLKMKSYTVRDLVSISLFVNDLSLYSKFNTIYCDIIDKTCAPVRTCLATILPENSTVLIEAIAHKPSKNSINNASSNMDGDSNKSTDHCILHVQSVSHWAPANIGPYSQAIRVGNIIFVAGQIGLIPGSMQMIQDEGISRECRLSLRHISRIISAVDRSTLLRDVIQVICFVTNEKYIKHARKEWEKRSNNAIVDYVVVTTLPRNARVEWQVWVHRENATFQYEETGCRLDQHFKAFLRRRFNYENTVSAVVSHLARDHRPNVVDKSRIESINEESLNKELIRQFLTYTLKKLTSDESNKCKPIYSLRLFYPVLEQIIFQYAYEILIELSENLPVTFTFVPVLRLLHTDLLLFVSAIRHY